MKRCYLCNRRMVNYRSVLTLLFPSRIDCGGDCKKCIEEIEHDLDETSSKLFGER